MLQKWLLASQQYEVYDTGPLATCLKHEQNFFFYCSSGSFVRQTLFIYYFYFMLLCCAIILFFWSFIIQYTNVVRFVLPLFGFNEGVHQRLSQQMSIFHFPGPSPLNRVKIEGPSPLHRVKIQGPSPLHRVRQSKILPCTVRPVQLYTVQYRYLISFSIGNFSYTPCV